MSSSDNSLMYDLLRLQTFVNSFKKSSYWKSMESTVEASPWHREKNVAVHTDMALQAAVRWFPLPTGTCLCLTCATNASDPTMLLDQQLHCEFVKDDRRHIVLVTLAILFHDVGKPIKEVTKESEERGVYRSYANHEQASARSFEGYCINNWHLFDNIISKWDVYLITWIIEHHLPYSIKDKNKLNALCGTISCLFAPNGSEVFYNVLRGDTAGRESDNYDVKFANTQIWIDDTEDIVREITTEFASHDSHQYKRQLTMMVGPAGAGKSSLVADHIASNNCDVFSLDVLRVEFATNHNQINDTDTKAEGYQKAFRFCTDPENEPQFEKFVDTQLQSLFNGTKDIVIDNTNTSIKSRRKYLAMARQRNMFCVAQYIPTSFNLLLSRNNTRSDKQLPPEAISRQFLAVAVPSCGPPGCEFDDLWYETHNFPDIGI